MVQEEGQQGGKKARDGEAHGERQERSGGEPEVPADDADSGRRDRQQVRADRHRADDEEWIAIDDAVAPDDPGHRHEPEVATDEPRVGAGDAHDVGPDEARVPPAPAQLPDELDAGQGDVGRRDGEALELVEDVVDGVMGHVGLQHRAPGLDRAYDPDLRGAGHLVHARSDARDELGFPGDPQVQHPVDSLSERDAPRLIRCE